MVETGLSIYLKTLSSNVHVLTLPANPKYPAIVYTPISAPRQLLLDGSGEDLRRDRIQVDVWGRTYKSAKNLVETLCNGLSGFTGDFNGTEITRIEVTEGISTKEPEDDLYRVSTDLIINY